MKQLMELLGLDIPKWEGPTVCESSTGSSEVAPDVKPPRALPAKGRVKKNLVKDERKREATQITDNGNVKEEILPVKREREDSPVVKNEEK